MIKNEDKEKIIKTYKAFYNKAIENNGKSILSKDKLLAIGQKVFNEIVETAFEHMDIPQKEREEYYNEIKQIIKEGCQNTLWDAGIVNTGNGFLKTIQHLYEILKPIGFSINQNTLKGSNGVIIEYIDEQKQLFCIKKYLNKDYSGEPIIWGIENGLKYNEALTVLRQIFIDIEW